MSGLNNQDSYSFKLYLHIQCLFLSVKYFPGFATFLTIFVLGHFLQGLQRFVHSDVQLFCAWTCSGVGEWKVVGSCLLYTVAGGVSAPLHLSATPPPHSRAGTWRLLLQPPSNHPLHHQPLQSPQNCPFHRDSAASRPLQQHHMCLTSLSVPAPCSLLLPTRLPFRAAPNPLFEGELVGMGLG